MRLALVAALLLWRSPAQGDGPLFSFLQISDADTGLRPGEAGLLEQGGKDVNGLVPAPAFVIVTGDLTEDGKAEEYAEYKRIIAGLKPGIDHHACPGNHETTVGRWSDFEKQIG